MRTNTSSGHRVFSSLVPALAVLLAALAYPILADQADLPFAPAVTAGLLITIVAAIVLIGLQAPAFDLRRLKLPGVFMLAYAMFVIVPAAFFAFDREDGPARNLFFTVASAMVTFPLGVFIVRAIASKRRDLATRSTPIELEEIRRPSAQTMTYIWTAFFAVSLAVVTLYTLTVPNVPLLQAVSLSGDVETLQLEREESFKLLPGPLAYFFSWARLFFLPYFGLVAAASVRKPSLGWRLRIFLSFVIALLFAAASTAKGPAIAVLAMFIALGYLMGRGSSPLRRLAVLAAGAVVIAVLYYRVVFGEGFTTEEALQSFFLRIFQVPSAVAYYYYAIFPDVLPHQGGQTIRLVATMLSGLFDVRFFDVDNFIFRVIFPYGLASGSANAVFIAYLWVDFGWVGVLSGGVLLGMFVQAVEMYVGNRPDVWTVALRAYLVIAVTLFHASSIPVVLLTDGVIVGWATAHVLRRLFPASTSPDPVLVRKPQSRLIQHGIAGPVRRLGD